MKRRILLCPNCNSSDNSVNWEDAWAVNSGNFKNFRKCNRCGYVGQLFTEPSESEPYEVEDIRVPKRLWDDRLRPAISAVKIQVWVLLAILVVIMGLLFLGL